MTKLAAASGIIIYEDGLRVYISKRSATWISTFLFVTGILTIIFLINGLVQLFALKDHAGPTKLGIILTLVGVFSAILFWRAWVYKSKINARPFNELPTIAVIDLETKNLLNGQHQVLAPLQQVWLDRKMQITSSSPELIIRWNGGTLSLAKGNPFSGGVAPIEKALISKGIRKG